MQSKAQSPEEYIQELPDDRKEAIIKLRNLIKRNLPAGFSEVMSYGMIGYIVPLSLYPAGYHTGQGLPLPFINIASQKNFIAVYHMGIYADRKLNEWFVSEYPKHSKTKLDMGKGCIRFKKINQIPYELIGELSSKITPQEWIHVYEMNLHRKN